MKERTCFPATRATGTPRYAVLGPCRCMGCGESVYWAHSYTRESWNGPVIKGFLRWREAGGRIHKCAARKAA